MRTFQETLALLRRDRRLSQRQAAAALGISQALLSHYENGAREPGLDFVRRACDYYEVSADYLLGRSDEPKGRDLSAVRAMVEQMRAVAERAGTALDSIEGRQP